MPARIDVSRAASITVVVGSSGSGKSAWLKKQLATLRRVVVWDPDDEYAGMRGFTRITTIAALAAALKGASAGRFALVPSSMGQFDAWALCAFAWGNCTAVAEETADVTTPGKAPPGWGALVRRGRKRGIQIFAVTQRPSESDKTVIGQRTCIHVCYLERPGDRDYIARETGIDRAVIDALQPLEWLEKRRGNGPILRGKLKF